MYLKRVCLVFGLLCLNHPIVVMAQGYTDTTIYEVQQDLFAIGDSIRVTNVVVIGVDLRPSTYGVYIQEQSGGAYSGALAYRSGTLPAYETPNGAQPVSLGDRITVEGIVDDFGGLTEISNPIMTFLSTGPELMPEILSVDSLSTGYAGAERWEGVLVQVQNALVTSVNQFSNWYLETSPGSGLLSGYEKMFSGQIVPVVGSFITVTGAADWAFGERRIAPRDNDDIVPGTGTIAVDEATMSEVKAKYREE